MKNLTEWKNGEVRYNLEKQRFIQTFFLPPSYEQHRFDEMPDVREIQRVDHKDRNDAYTFFLNSFFATLSNNTAVFFER